MAAENIALIELGGSHDECLYSQVLFLKKYGYRVHIILFSEQLERMEKWKQVDSWKTFEKVSGMMGKWKLVRQVQSYLRQNNIQYAVINTAEGNIIRLLSLLPGREINYTGLIHLSRKLWSSRSQRIINRKIKKYFVLADFISENLDQADPSLSISYFYPVYFPSDQEKPKISGKSGISQEFRVNIPGAVDFSRRDYDALMDELCSGEVPEGLQFILLGRTNGPDGLNLLARIHEEKLEKYFTWFEGFVESREFYRQLSRADLILPLITPGSYDYEEYLKYKITGTYNLAWGFQIPMLMHDSFKEYEVFRDTSEFYKTGRIIKTITELDKNKLGLIKEGIEKRKDFNFEIQAEKYINFIRL